MPSGNHSKLAACAALMLAVLTAPALAQKRYGPGVTDTEIKIGTTTPYSGPASAYSAGAPCEAVTSGVPASRLTKMAADTNFAVGLDIFISGADASRFLFSARIWVAMSRNSGVVGA